MHFKQEHAVQGIACQERIFCTRHVYKPEKSTQALSNAQHRQPATTWQLEDAQPVALYRQAVPSQAEADVKTAELAKL